MFMTFTARSGISTLIRSTALESWDSGRPPRIKKFSSLENTVPPEIDSGVP